MKRTKRIVALTLALLLCLPLCSCKELDDMRAVHTLRQGDGTILWDGTIFVPYDDYLLSELENVGYKIDHSFLNRMVLTDANVPVLLSDSMFGQTIFSNADKTILYSYPQDKIYLRSEEYERLVAYIWAEIEAYRSKRMGTQYKLWVYVSQVDKHCFIPLSESQKYAVDYALSKVKPEWSKSMTYADSVTIRGYNEDGDWITTIASLLKQPDGHFCLVVNGHDGDWIYAIQEEQTDELAAAYDSCCTLLSTAAEDWPPENVTFYEG